MLILLSLLAGTAPSALLPTLWHVHAVQFPGLTGTRTWRRTPQIAVRKPFSCAVTALSPRLQLQWSLEPGHWARQWAASTLAGTGR